MKRPGHAEVVRALLAWEKAINSWDEDRNCLVFPVCSRETLARADRRLRSLARRLRKPEGKR